MILISREGINFFFNDKCNKNKSLKETIIIINKKIRKDNNTKATFIVVILLINLSKSANFKSMASNNIVTATAINVILELCLFLKCVDNSFSVIIISNVGSQIFSSRSHKYS